MTKTVKLPPAEELKPGQVDPETQFLFFDRSPEATKAWCEAFLTIPDLEKRIVPVHLFPQQDLMLQDATGRDTRVKGRQSRTSSLEMMVTVRELTTNWGLTVLTGAHDDANTELMRERIKHHLNDLKSNGIEYKLIKDNDDEIVLGGLESRIIFQSGERRIIARSFTAHRVHFAELAHWRSETAGSLLGGLKPSVPGPPNGAIVLESTPNGAEGVFYDEVMDSKPYNANSMWTTHFYPWWMEPRYRVGSDTSANIVIPDYDFQRQMAEFNPTEEEARLMQRNVLRPDQILWRRIMQAEMAKTTTPFLQEFPESLEGCFLSVSGNYFQTPDGFDHLEWYRTLVTAPVMELAGLEYRKTPIRLDATGGSLAVWEFHDPTQVYVAFVDAASGEQGERSDYTTINVLNAWTLHKVARFRAKITPRDAGNIAAAIGEFYGNCLLGVERGGYGSGVLDQLREINYPNLHYHFDPVNPKKEIKAGLYMTQPMREKVLQALRTNVVTHAYVTRDALEVAEMGTFDWTKVQGRLKVQAVGARGAHDDILMSVAGCLFIAPEARTRRKVQESRRSDDVILVGRYGNIIGRERENNPGGSPPWAI